jgi:hypothetical protein
MSCAARLVQRLVWLRPNEKICCSPVRHPPALDRDLGDRAYASLHVTSRCIVTVLGDSLLSFSRRLALLLFPVSDILCRTPSAKRFMGGLLSPKGEKTCEIKLGCQKLNKGGCESRRVFSVGEISRNVYRLPKEPQCGLTNAVKCCASDAYSRRKNGIRRLRRNLMRQATAKAIESLGVAD